MISFIIPTYNAESSLKRAIESILNQKETNLQYEIIVIADGKQDYIDEIINNFNDTRIKYFVKEHSGVADTRNYGVNKAIGEYIIFVDCDDYISNTLLKDIENYINEDIDLIKWNPIFVDENGNILSNPESVSFARTTGEKGFNLLFGKDNLIDCLWNYAIKKELVIEFPTGTYHEDFATMPLMVLKSKTMVSIPNREYFYVQSKNSIIRNDDKQKFRKKLEDKLGHFDNLISKVNQMNLQKITKENLAIYATNAILSTMPELDEENKKFLKQELKKRKISKYIKIRNLKQLLKKVYFNIKY